MKDVYLKIPEVFIILLFQLLIMKFHVRILLWTGAVLNWSWEVTGNESEEKIFIPAIYLYASLRFFHFLFYRYHLFFFCHHLFLFVIISFFFLSSSLFLLLSWACSFFSVLYIFQFCMLAFLRIHSSLKVSNFPITATATLTSSC